MFSPECQCRLFTCRAVHSVSLQIPFQSKCPGRGSLQEGIKIKRELDSNAHGSKLTFLPRKHGCHLDFFFVFGRLKRSGANEPTNPPPRRYRKLNPIREFLSRIRKKFRCAATFYYLHTDRFSLSPQLGLLHIRRVEPGNVKITPYK